MTIKKSGELQYTPRAFKQDAEDAIKGDVVRALIEFITNADDAYDSKGGSIEISVSRTEKPFQVLMSVHDKATGLSAEGLETAFARLGDLNQKFVGDKGTRGLFGRGAKDVAILGKARFVSIKNGRFSSLEIDPVLVKFSMEDIDENVSSAALKECKLAIGQSGLTAELFVSEIHRIPSPVEMVKKLQSHVQLRDLLNRNHVTYADERNNSEIRLVGLEPTGELLLKKDVQISKYKHPVHLEIYKLEEKITTSLDEYSVHGLVITGRGAAYENSFLNLSRRPEAGWFCGRIDAPEIHDLARSIDIEKSSDVLNPTRIVSRQRGGLVQNHPYYHALALVIQNEIKPLFDAMAEEEGSQRKESDTLRKKFDALSPILANILQEILDESEAGELPTSSDDDGSIFALSIIPPRRLVKVGDTVTLTLRAPERFDLNSIKISLEQKSEVFSLEREAFKQGEWRKHPRLPVLQKSIRIKALYRGTATLSAITDLVRADCELIAVNFEPVVEIEPDHLIFEPDTVKVAPTKTKKLLVRAPLEYVGERVYLSLTNNYLNAPDSVVLRSSKFGKSSEGMIQVVADVTEGRSQVIAKISNGEEAVCLIDIQEIAHNKNPKIKVVVVGNENPPRRVDTLPEEGQLLIRIFGRHRSLSKVLGKSSLEGFEHDKSPAAQATIVEIVAQQLSIYAVERDSEKNPDRYQDAPSIFFRQMELIPKFISALQAGLLDLQ